MNLIRLSIERPVAVLAVVLLVVLAGVVALLEIPIQLAPFANFHTPISLNRVRVSSRVCSG